MVTLNDSVAYLAEHYIYEINMLRETHRRLGSTSDQMLANALIESFCVHARALLDFYKSTPQDDDVVAHDFVTPAQFTATATRQVPNDIRKRVNKQIAHLTAARENANRINDGDRQQLLTAIETDHAAFKAAALNIQKFANCFIGEIAAIAVPVGSVHSATNVVQASSSTTSSP